MTYSWHLDALGSWEFYMRWKSITTGPRRAETVAEMYWIESAGGIP